MGLSKSNSPGGKRTSPLSPPASSKKPKSKRLVSSGGIPKQAKQQLGQLAKGTFEELKSQPGGMAKRALEQVGMGGSSSRPESPSAEEVKKKIQEMERMDKKRSETQIAQIKKKLDEEIKYWQQLREEQLRRRRKEPTEEEQKKVQEQEVKEKPLAVPGEGQKPKKGGFLMRKRKKTQVEKVGGRVSG
jgi:hypothetical protein